MDQGEKKYQETNGRMENRVAEMKDQIRANEERTLWSINDCWELLKNRVTDEYVQKVGKNLEERIMGVMKQRMN